MGEYKNDKEIFREIYDETYYKLRMYVRRRSCDSSMIDDILQEVYIEVYRHIEVIRNHNNRIGWVYKTAENKVKKLNCTCRKYYYKNLALDDCLNYIPVKETTISNFVYEELNRILDKNEVQLLKKKYIEGYRNKDLANVTGITESGIKMRLSRIIKKARKCNSLHEFLM